MFSVFCVVPIMDTHHSTVMVLLLMLVDGEFPSDLTSEKFDSFNLNGT